MDRKSTNNWINTLLSSLEDKDEMLGKSVLEECGRACCIEHGVLAKAKEIGNKAINLNDDEKFNLLYENFLGHGISFYKESGMIYFEYSKCKCSMKTDENELDGFLCECTRGFAKALMETLYRKSVEVTIMKTILRGDEKCQLAVRII